MTDPIERIPETEEKRRKKHKYLWTSITLFAAAALAIVFYFLLDRFPNLVGILSDVADLLRPIIIGAVLAYILKPLCNTFEKVFSCLFRRMKNPKKLVEGLSIALSIITGLLVVYLLLVMIIPALYDSVRSIIEPFLSEGTLTTSPFVHVRGWIASWLPPEHEMHTAVMGALDEVESWIRATVSSDAIKEWLSFDSIKEVLVGVGAGVGVVIGAVVDVFVGVVAAVYVLAARKRLGAQARLLTHSILPDRWAKSVVNEARYADRMFSGYVYSRVIDSFIVGAVCFIGLLFMNTRYALLIAVVVGVTNIIPFFGPFIGAIPSGLLLLIENPINCLWFAIFILVLQQIDGNIIAPRISGDVIGLPPLWVLFAVLLFGGMFGFWGMLIGEPVFAVIYDVVRRAVNLGLRRNGKAALMADYSAQFTEKGRRPATSPAETVRILREKWQNRKIFRKK